MTDAGFEAAKKNMEAKENQIQAQIKFNEEIAKAVTILGRQAAHSIMEIEELADNKMDAAESIIMQMLVESSAQTMEQSITNALTDVNTALDPEWKHEPVPELTEENVEELLEGLFGIGGDDE